MTGRLTKKDIIDLIYTTPPTGDRIEAERPCPCDLKPEHSTLEHDWCCQICGGQHTERLCPNSDCPLKEACSHFGGCTHSDFKECNLYIKIKSDKKGKKWAKGLHWKKKIQKRGGEYRNGYSRIKKE